MNNYYEKFAEAARSYPKHTAIEVQYRERLASFTYGELSRMTESVADFLLAKGIKAQDRCAIVAENDAHWCAAYLGVLRCGGVAVPLDTSYQQHQITALLEDSRARIIIASPGFFDTVKRACAGLNHNHLILLLKPSELSDEHEVLAFDRPLVSTPAAVSVDDPAVILYTSGTTSDPKGVVLSHGNLLGANRAVLQVIPATEKDAILGVLPLFHALAQMANLLLPLSVGARVVFLETINTTELLRALKEREISLFCCVPQFFYMIHQRVFEEIAKAGRVRRLLAHSLLRANGFCREIFRINLGRYLFSPVHRSLGPWMRLFVTGGASFDGRIGRDLFRMGFNILQAYGLTETSGAVSILRPGDKQVTSAGEALPEVEIKIVPTELGDRLDGDSVALSPVGEVAVRGSVVFQGYFNRPDVDRLVFREGWFHTGDLGYLDDAGRLYITGRLKEVIVLSSGKNIYPEEIEAHYATSSFIKELCVLGLSRSHEPVAERLHAVVVPDTEALRKQRVVNVAKLLRWEIETLSTKLPGHKRILSYDIAAEDLPRTTTKKLKRFEIEARLKQQASTVVDTVSEDHQSLSTDPTTSRVIKRIQTITGHQTISRQANLELDLGLDSLERVELLATLERDFGVQVAEEVVHNIYTVGELVDAIGQAEKGGVVATTDSNVWQKLLHEISDDDPLLHGLLKLRPLRDMGVFCLLQVVYWLSRLLFRFRIAGQENLPANGPYLICPNHQTYIDPFLLLSRLPYRVFRQIFFVGAAEYFQAPFTAWVARINHIIPIDPDSHLLRALQAGAYGLKHKKILMLFPEGERSIDGEIKVFAKGMAILALHLGVPVVPVAIEGAFDYWPRGHGIRWQRLIPFFNKPIQMQIGSAIEPPQTTTNSEELISSFTNRIRTKVTEMQQTLRRL